MENITQGQWFRGPSADLGTPINQSLRFDHNSTQCLRRDWSDNGNRQTFTFSTWLKKADFGSNSRIWTEGDDGGATYFTSLMFQGADDKLRFYTYNGSDVQHNHVSTQRFRDENAWYHLVVAVDTTLSTAADRIKIYVNGEEITAWDTQTHATLNYNTFVGYSGGHANIGQYVNGNSGTTGNGFSGYMAETIFIDGSQLAVTEFGRTNEDGVWVPKAYSGSYSGHSWRLQYDSSAGLGDDTSGLSNDFTAHNFETTALSSSNFENDIDYNDTPTNNYATLNAANLLGSKNVKNSNLTVYATGSGVTDVSSTIPASLFDCYFEVNNAVGSGLRGVGVGDYRARISQGTSSYLTYRENGAIVRYPGNTSLGTESSYTTDDVIGVAVTSTQISFYKNGTLEGTYTHGLTGDFYAIGMAYYSGGNAELDFNFGQMAFRHTVPTGFKALNSNNLAEPTIKDSSQHFDILTYTGNGTNRTLSGLNFQPDFTWIKNRASGHYVMQDSVRGASKQLFIDNLASEQTNATNFVTSFTSDGFTSGPSAQGSGDTNSNGSSFVAYCWKGGGTAVSNTDGSITSSVSANTDAGFSIVTYTGTGANATVGHGLNSAPECVLVKDRENSNYHWQMWHTALSSNDHSLLPNDPSAEGDFNAWQNTAPTNSVVSLGSANGVNASSNDHVMYCWHGVEGYSKFGQYEANNSTDGPFIWCGFKPRWLLIKKLSGSNQWRLYDSARDTYNPRDTLLFPDSSESEATSSTYYLDFLSNGFKIRNNHSSINSSGGHMFMAFAELPFGGTNAAPLTAV